MKTVIIEDEALAAERLEKMLRELEPGIEIMDKLTSVKEAVDWLKEYSPDLIFLDIQLSDGLSFKIFDEITIKAPIIFTTAYDQYAIRAFRVNSIDYLLKPIRREELTASFNKYKNIKSYFSPDFSEALSMINSGKTEYKSRFLVQYGQKIKKIEVKDIAFFYALEKNVFMATFDNLRYPADYTLDSLDDILEPKKFFRINRKIIINYDAIKNMIPYSKSRIKVEMSVNPPEEIEAVVSVERSPKFKEWLDT